MNNQADVVQALVARLPEVYQPIYGYPQLSEAASRATEDRLSEIRRVHDALSSRLGRSLRVLDLGCAQGFISLSLASLGARVVGVEMLPENAELCRKLGALNPTLDVKFIEGRIEEFALSLEDDAFDMVILLSVIHHVAFHVSPEVAEATVARIRRCAPVLVAELAVAEEPLYWAAALPAEPTSIFGDARFVREIGRTGTHLSGVARPLFFVSDTYWYLGGGVEEIRDARRGGHRFAKKSFRGSRSYFFSDNYLLKVLSVLGEDAEVNRLELEREVTFLDGMAGEEGYPKLVCVDEDVRSMFLLRELIPGRLLVDLIDEGQKHDYYLVIRDLLGECIKLERRGLYHQDVRVWNVLARDDGGYCLIDYGAISDVKNDCFWPQNIYIAFLIFIRELLSAPRILSGPIREVGVTPYGFSGHLSFWVAELSKRPLADWSFEMMLALLEGAFLTPGASAVEPGSAHEALLKMLEEAVTVLAREQNGIASRLEDSDERVTTLVQAEAERISNLHNDLLAVSKEQHLLVESQKGQASQLSVLQQALDDQRIQGVELLRRFGYIEKLLGETRDLAATGNAHCEALRSVLDQVADQLDRHFAELAGQIDQRHAGLGATLEEGVGRMEARVDLDLARILAAHEELLREVAEIKAQVFRKGFWGRLLSH